MGNGERLNDIAEQVSTNLRSANGCNRQLPTRGRSLKLVPSGCHPYRKKTQKPEHQMNLPLFAPRVFAKCLPARKMVGRGIGIGHTTFGLKL